MRPLRKEILLPLASTKDAVLKNHYLHHARTSKQLQWENRFVFLLEHAYLMDRQCSHIKRETFCSDLNSFT